MGDVFTSSVTSRHHARALIWRIRAASQVSDHRRGMTPAMVVTTTRARCRSRARCRRKGARAGTAIDAPTTAAGHTRGHAPMSSESALAIARS